MTRAPRAAWLAVLALPVVALGARWTLDARDEAHRSRPEQDLAARRSGAEVWLGAGDVVSGVRLDARVAALHRDPRRQDFEGRALRTRFPEIAGDPYLVLLELRGGGEAVVDPSRATVVDEEGVALVAARLPVPARPDAVATILREPGEIRSGERASFVLFGRAPVDGAELVVGDLAPIPLAKSVAAQEVGDLPVARVDRRSDPDPEDGR